MKQVKAETLWPPVAVGRANTSGGTKRARCSGFFSVQFGLLSSRADDEMVKKV